MKQNLQDRALFTLDDSGIAICGTYHKPYDRLMEAGLRASACSRLGVVFVNALSTPRSGYGDSAVYWAKTIAALGYPVFRIDLPGLGDTPGSIPRELLTHITGGGYAAIVMKTIRELVACFGLSGAVVVGHCAGAVTALHAASEHKSCKGLVLMDPYFNYPKQLAPKLPPRVVLWSRNNRLGTLIRNGYGWARELSRTEGLPTSTNFALLRQWKNISSRGVPILVLQTLNNASGVRSFDYLAYILARAERRSQVEVRMIADTDHSFSNETGRRHVRAHAETWLKQFFPIQPGSKLVPEREALQ